MNNVKKLISVALALGLKVIWKPSVIIPDIDVK